LSTTQWATVGTIKLCMTVVPFTAAPYPWLYKSRDAIGLFRSAKVSTFCVNSSISPSLSNFEPKVSAVACCFLGGFSNHSRGLKQDDVRAFPAVSVNFCGRPLIDHKLSAIGSGHRHFSRPPFLLALTCKQTLPMK